MREAMRLGCDVIGGIPHYEWTREDGVEEVNFLFDLARETGAPIDLHCDETDDEQSRFLEVVAARTMRDGMQGRVVAGHTTAMGSYNDAYAFKLLQILKRAGVTIVANPLDNIVLQGRFDTYPEAARDDPGQGARRGRRQRRLRPRLDHGPVVPAGPRLDARRAVDARPRRPDDGPGRALPSLRDGHDEPGPRRRGAVRHRGGQAGELRGLRLRRRGRGDPPPTGGALGRPQWPGRRRDRTGTERRARRREPPARDVPTEWRGERPGRCRRWHQWNRRVVPEMAGAGPNRAWTEEGADR